MSSTRRSKGLSITVSPGAHNRDTLRCDQKSKRDEQSRNRQGHTWGNKRWYRFPSGSNGVDEVVDFGGSETPVEVLHVNAEVGFALEFHLANDVPHTGDIHLRVDALDDGEEFTLALHAINYTYFVGLSTSYPIFF